MRDCTVERKKMVVDTISKVFEEEGIDRISIKKISKITGVPTASLNRYFGTIGGVVVECIAAANRKVFADVRKVYLQKGGENFTGIEEMEFFFDTFIDLYQHRKGFLRFSLDFTLFALREKITPDKLVDLIAAQKQYSDMFAKGFNKGIYDGTINPNLTLESVYYTCFHCMLATSQKFAVGVSPITKKDSLKELQMLKEIQLNFLKNPKIEI